MKNKKGAVQLFPAIILIVILLAVGGYFYLSEKEIDLKVPFLLEAPIPIERHGFQQMQIYQWYEPYSVPRGQDPPTIHATSITEGDIIWISVASKPGVKVEGLWGLRIDDSFIENKYYASAETRTTDYLYHISLRKSAGLTDDIFNSPRLGTYERKTDSLTIYENNLEYWYINTSTIGPGDHLIALYITEEEKTDPLKLVNEEYEFIIIGKSLGVDPDGAERYAYNPTAWKKIFVKPLPCKFDSVEDIIVIDKFVAGEIVSKEDLTFTPITTCSVGEQLRTDIMEYDQLNFFWTNLIKTGESKAVPPSMVVQISYVAKKSEIGIEISCDPELKYDWEQDKCLATGIFTPCGEGKYLDKATGSCLAIPETICRAGSKVDIETGECIYDVCKELSPDAEFIKEYGRCGVRAKYSFFCPFSNYDYLSNSCLNAGPDIQERGEEACVELNGVYEGTSVNYKFIKNDSTYYEGNDCSAWIKEGGRTVQDYWVDNSTGVQKIIPVNYTGCEWVSGTAVFGSCSTPVTYDCSAYPGTEFVNTLKDYPACLYGVDVSKPPEVTVVREIETITIKEEVIIERTGRPKNIAHIVEEEEPIPEKPPEIEKLGLWDRLINWLKGVWNEIIY